MHKKLRANIATPSPPEAAASTRALGVAPTWAALSVPPPNQGLLLKPEQAQVLTTAHAKASSGNKPWVPLSETESTKARRGRVLKSRVRGVWGRALLAAWIQQRGWEREAPGMSLEEVQSDYRTGTTEWHSGAGFPCPCPLAPASIGTKRISTRGEHVQVWGSWLPFAITTDTFTHTPVVAHHPPLGPE